MQCPSVQMRSCYYCKGIGHHHCSICPKTFDHGQLSNGTCGQLPSGTGDQTMVTLQCHSQLSMAASEADVEPASVTNNVNLSHSLLVGGERLLLQMAKVTVLAGDVSRVSANLLLDSASQQMFMKLDNHVVNFTITTQES